MKMIELKLTKPLPTNAVDTLQKIAPAQWECTRIKTPGLNTPLWRLTIIKLLSKSERYEIYAALETAIPDFESKKLTHG